MTTIELIKKCEDDIWERIKANKKWSMRELHDVENIVIEENKKNHVYWDYDCWIYDKVNEIKQDFSVSGQERTRRFVESLNQLNGCVVSENDAGYTLEIFTPYKVYLYRFNRGYGDYYIHIEKGYIAPGGNTYKNEIFIAENARDMKARYHSHRGFTE